MRWWLCCALMACTKPPAPPNKPAPPRAAHVAPSLEPGARLAAASVHDRALEVPGSWIDGHPELDGLFPPLAYSLDERWVFSFNTVCRSAFYSEDLPTLQSAHAVWSELVAALAGDEQFKEARLARAGVRLHLTRERYCIDHNCKPPLSPPSVNLDVCDDKVVVADRTAVLRTLIARLPALAGHEALLAVPGVTASIAAYSRHGDGRDEVKVTLEANAAAQSELRALLVARGYATVDPNGWSVNSTSKLRSYLFYPVGNTTSVAFEGRTL